jgi:dTDP-4-dehydrorhamnose 3,5-epimerase
MMEVFGGLQVEKLKTFPDDRGHFSEIFKTKDKIFPVKFVQDNCSVSKKGVIRGLHYQIKLPQAKLVYCLSGKIFDVAVDLRTNSKHFGKWYGIELSSENNLALYIPEGFAHGFQSLKDNSVVYYKCSSYYQPEYDRSLHYESLGILWHDLPQIVSEKDKLGKQFNDCDKFTEKDLSLLSIK